MTEKKTNIEAIIFDLDGVIIDSEELHAKAKKAILDRYRIAYPATLFDTFKGRPDIVFWNYIANELTGGRYRAADLDAQKREAYIALAGEMKSVPGVFDFIAWAKQKFSRLALVSSATERDLMISENLFQIKKWFDCILLDEDTTQHKPHPEPYLTALKKLNLEAFKALVIEDSPNGVKAAKSAGCFVIGITTGFSREELKAAGADNMASTFSEIKNILTGIK